MDLEVIQKGCNYKGIICQTKVTMIVGRKISDLKRVTGEINKFLVLASDQENRDNLVTQN